MESYTAILYGKECNTEKQIIAMRIENLFCKYECYNSSRTYLEVYLDRVINIYDYRYIGVAFTGNNGIIDYEMF